MKYLFMPWTNKNIIEINIEYLCSCFVSCFCFCNNNAFVEIDNFFSWKEFYCCFWMENLYENSLFNVANWIEFKLNSFFYYYYYYYYCIGVFHFPLSEKWIQYYYFGGEYNVYICLCVLIFHQFHGRFLFEFRECISQFYLNH